MVKFGIARKFAKDISNFIVKLNEESVNAYEMGFAYGIPEYLSEEILSLSIKNNVKLSGHLPFWINLGNSSNEKNLDYLISGLKIAENLDSVAVFHLGFYNGENFSFLKRKIVKIIQNALSISNITNGKLGIETTGKQKAIGTIDEIIEIISLIGDDRIIPIIDWSHIFARNNGSKPYSHNDFREILEKFETKLEFKPFYFHGGGVEYKNGNEIRHLSAKICNPPLPYLFSVLKDKGYNDFTFIIESPDGINDHLWLKQVWKCPDEYYHLVPARKSRTLFDFTN